MASGGQGRSIAAWCLYDWASSAFNTLIITFVFSVYFARGVYGDAVAGSVAWADALAISGLIIAFGSPVLGAIADRGGRRKPWLLVFAAITIGATALLWTIRPEAAFVPMALFLVVIANTAFEFSNVFYNAMLLSVAPRGKMGRVSGWGWALGYGGGLACLAVALAGFIQPETPWLGVEREDGGNIRATALLVALWFAVFALPLFLFARDEPARKATVVGAVTGGLRVLWGTIREVRRYGSIMRFLLASLFYRDGLATLFIIGGLYAAGTFAMTQEDILLFAIALNVASGLGAFAFGYVDDRVGPKRTVLFALAGLVAFGLPLLLISDITWFFILAGGLGIFVGPAQAAGRTLMARLAPPGKETEMFGLYAFSGKVTVFLGPFLFARLTEGFDSQRAGMSVIIAFFVLGGLILLTVREPASGR